jgi:hypothetical protein
LIALATTIVHDRLPPLSVRMAVDVSVQFVAGSDLVKRQGSGDESSDVPSRRRKCFFWGQVPLRQTT